jgi:hypothetical protein
MEKFNDPLLVDLKMTLLLSTTLQYYLIVSARFLHQNSIVSQVLDHRRKLIEATLDFGSDAPQVVECTLRSDPDDPLEFVHKGLLHFAVTLSTSPTAAWINFAHFVGVDLIDRGTHEFNDVEGIFLENKITKTGLCSSLAKPNQSL